MARIENVKSPTELGCKWDIHNHVKVVVAHCVVCRDIVANDSSKMCIDCGTWLGRPLCDTCVEPHRIGRT